MKIWNWISDSMSAVNGYAVVEVDPGEVADYDAMVKMVDVGLNFGTHIHLLTVDEEPTLIWRGHGSSRVKDYQGKLPHVSTSEIHDHRRWYKVLVNRD